MQPLDDYVFDVLMRDLVGHDRKPASYLVYLWLAAEQRRREDAVQISYQDLAENIGISKSAAQAAAGWLVKRKLLAVSKESVTAAPKYAVLTPWRNAIAGTRSQAPGKSKPSDSKSQSRERE
jgi:hypothetical protein